MSEPIGPGDWVECVDASEPTGSARGTPFRLRLQALYQVLGATLDGLYLDSPETGGSDHSWLTYRFRPIYRPRASLIEALKAPVTRTPKVVKKAREDA